MARTFKYFIQLNAMSHRRWQYIFVINKYSAKKVFLDMILIYTLYSVKHSVMTANQIFASQFFKSSLQIKMHV